MDILDRRQAWPFLVTYVVTFFFIAASFGLLRYAAIGQTEVNRYYWFMARAAGFTSYELLALTVVLGLTSTSGVWDRLRARKLMTFMHQYASLLVIPFLGLHLWGLHMDQSVPFRWIQELVPLTATYRPLATGLGVLALYGLAVLIITSAVRRWIGVKAWRAIHFLSIPLFLAVSLHGLFSGTDSFTRWGFFLYAVPVALFFQLTVVRFFTDK